MLIIKEIFTLDNLFHGLVSVAFVILGWVFFGYAPLFALMSLVGFYLREASQVDWDFTLKSSLHKWLEATVGPTVGMLIAVLLSLL